MSALRTDRLYLPEDISSRGWFDARAVVRPEGLTQRKVPMTQSGIYFYFFYSCKTGVQEHLVSLHITTVGMNTGTTLSMGTKICEEIVPVNRWKATASSWTSIEPRHKGSMTDSQLHQSKFGTWVHVITRNLIQGTHHSHITPILWIRLHGHDIFHMCNIRTALRKEAISISKDTTPSHCILVTQSPHTTSKWSSQPKRGYILVCLKYNRTRDLPICSTAP